MELLSNPDVWIAFFMLCSLEIVLGIDNIVFIAILSGRLPAHQQQKARRLGLLLALITRIALLFSISWIMRLTEPLFDVLGQGVSGRDLILLLGGLFLLYKSVREIHHKVESGTSAGAEAAGHITYASAIGQIILLDLVFSLDSVITAVGMVSQIEVMIAAVVVSVGVMLWLAEPISQFVNRHPALKVLALSFLILIGTTLMAEGLHFHFPKGYIYFAMAFSVAVEFINIRIGSRANRA
ncbi:MAG: TerC family protein [Saprospiraceae bacterium]